MSTAFMRKPYRSNKRFGAVLVLALALALTVITPPVGQAAEVTPAFVGTSAIDTFSNGTAITWPDNSGGNASTFPSTIDVSGLTGTITNITVSLHNVSHSRPDDFDILVRGPQGGAVAIWSDACGGEVITELEMTFADGAGALPDTTDTTSGPCTGGTYAPTDYDTGETYDGHASTATTLGAAFNGTDPNGTWSLYVIDDRQSYVGSIAEGWSITITTPDPANTAPTISAISDRAMNVGTTLDITLSANDPDVGDTVTFGATSSDTGIVTVSVSGNTLTLTAVAVGTATITVTGSDGTDDAIPVTFNVTVLAAGEPIPEPTEPPVIYTEEDHRRAQAPLCMDLSGQTNPAVRAAVPGDAVPGGNVYCRVLAQDGVFPNPNDPGRVGDPGLIAYGVITAVDIFGVTGDGMAYPGFNHAVTVCLEGSGRFIFLSALNSPRTTYEVPSVADGGYTCGSIPAAGTVVLIPFAPQN